MAPLLSIITFLILLVPQLSCQQQQLTQQEPSHDSLDSFLFNFDANDQDLGCHTPVPDRDQLGDECGILRIFNQTAIDLMEQQQLDSLARHCACQLIGMRKLWTSSFDTEPSTRRLADTVAGALGYYDNQYRQPAYLWSDLDVTVHQISIYTATKDYFYKQSHNRSMLMDAALRKELDNHEMWRLTRRVCWKVARDTNNLYRYLENLNRISPLIFFKLVTTVEYIDVIYMASKACKLLVLVKFDQYKLRPTSSQYVSSLPGLNSSQDHDNDNLITRDIDLMLKDVSVHLLKCASWINNNGIRKPKTAQQLSEDCPMMVSEKVPTDWLIQHSTSVERSRHAVKCGCQLLLFNSTWQIMLRDPNVAVMSKALTGYMNRNKVPDFTDNPIWVIYSWFEDIMSKFKNHRKLAIKEIIRTQSGDPDPLIAENNVRYDALELLRRGCNYIVFNYNKGAKEAIEVKLIKYLGNLQLITQDPMFVFHLTLQDPNLFKLHALSKMCQSVI